MDCHVERENEVSYGESVLVFQRVDVDLPLLLKEGLELLHFFGCIRQRARVASFSCVRLS